MFTGKTGSFLVAICCTSVTFLALQCGLQITFAYIPEHGETEHTLLASCEC